MYRKRLKNKHSSKRLSRDPRMATCRVDARGAGAHTLCIVYYVAIVIIFCVFERPFAHLDLRLRTCTVFLLLYVLSTTPLFSVLHADGITLVTYARVRTGVARPAKCTEPLPGNRLI